MNNALIPCHTGRSKLTIGTPHIHNLIIGTCVGRRTKCDTGIGRATRALTIDSIWAPASNAAVRTCSAGSAITNRIVPVEITATRPCHYLCTKWRTLYSMKHNGRNSDQCKQRYCRNCTMLKEGKHLKRIIAKKKNLLSKETKVLLTFEPLESHQYFIPRFPLLWPA